MSGIDEARERLAKDPTRARPDDIRTVLAALDAAEEGLYRVYVELGEDTDGARNARELFGPMTRTVPGEWVPKLVREYRAEMEAESDDFERKKEAAERVRDELAAVIERTQDYVVRHHFDSTTGRAVDAMLDAVPADVLRERDAEKWEEGAYAASEGYDLPDAAQIHNPYREREEQS